MSQPQHGAHGQHREYQPSYSPEHYRAAQNASPRLLTASNAQNPRPPGSSSPLSPVYAPGYMRGGSPATPVMAQAYNPQQWSQSQMGFQRVLPVAANTREVTGMEGMEYCSRARKSNADLVQRPCLRLLLHIHLKKLQSDHLQC